MWENIDTDRHYLGEFTLDNETLQGEIIYNKENGNIVLHIQRQFSHGPGKNYGRIPLILGTLHSGAALSLYQNKCISNNTRLFEYQELVFQVGYIILGQSQETYNQLICVFENGLLWSRLSQIDVSDFTTIKHKSMDEPVYHWFDAKISFSTNLTNGLLSFPRKEVSRVIERLVVKIETDEKRSPSFFLSIRDKIMALISFAIKDNVNIEEQFVVDFDDYEMLGEQKHYRQKSLLTSEPYSTIHNTSPHDYSFFLPQLSTSDDTQATLTKLTPVFNLYLSLFKYKDMPIEMVFLHIVQALETFHARFFYDDKKEKYIESVFHRFEKDANFDQIKLLLLNDTQMDKNCNYIILVSRLNDLLIGKNNGLFSDYYAVNNTYAQSIADTRHYYTHYGKSKENKAFKGDELLNVIHVLRLLLDYYICQSIGLDIEEKTRSQLSLLRT